MQGGPPTRGDPADAGETMKTGVRVWVAALAAACIDCSLLESFDGYTGGEPGESEAGTTDAEHADTRQPPFLTDSSTTPPKDSPGTPDSAALPDSTTKPDSTTTTGDTGANDCPNGTPFSPVPWAPPTPLQEGACSVTAADFFVQAFFANGDLTSGDTTCDLCIMTGVGNTLHGPLVITGTGGGVTYYEVNYGGCIADLDECTTASCCGNVVNEGNDCLRQECAECSDGPGDPGCDSAAFAGTCAAYYPSTQCMAEMNGGGSYAVCMIEGGSQQAFLAFIELWCGGTAPDAGGPGDGAPEQ